MKLNPQSAVSAALKSLYSWSGTIIFSCLHLVLSCLKHCEVIEQVLV